MTASARPGSADASCATTAVVRNGMSAAAISTGAPTRQRERVGDADDRMPRHGGSIQTVVPGRLGSSVSGLATIATSPRTTRTRRADT